MPSSRPPFTGCAIVRRLAGLLDWAGLRGTYSRVSPKMTISQRQSFRTLWNLCTKTCAILQSHSSTHSNDTTTSRLSASLPSSSTS